MAEVLAGFDRPWWVAGGWSIEAFTGARREHEDVDVGVLACDVPALREHLAGDWTPWSNDGGTFRPLNDTFPDAFHDESQIWLRRDSASPWVVDILVTPDEDGRWVNKRWREHVAPLDEVTWVADDGIRYLDPEISLQFKAKHRRPKDERDLETAWPLLSAAQREWLVGAIRSTEPGHAWLERLAPYA